MGSRRANFTSRAALVALAIAASVSSAPRADTRARPPARPSSFAQAKRLASALYEEHRVEFYCGCSYSAAGLVDPASCGYVPKRSSKRAHRMEWEHVVPAEAFGQSFAEWRDGHPDCVTAAGRSYRGRRCATRASALFRQMEADPYNLVPALGEVNGLRKNYSMGMLPGEARAFGTCDVEIASRTIEPRPEIRGDIARIYFYMSRAYPGRGVVSAQNQKLFEAWSKDDPPDVWECGRARRIQERTGMVNNVVEPTCASILQAERSGAAARPPAARAR